MVEDIPMNIKLHDDKDIECTLSVSNSSNNSFSGIIKKPPQIIIEPEEYIEHKQSDVNLKKKKKNKKKQKKTYNE